MSRGDPRSIKAFSAQVLRRFGRHLDDSALWRLRWQALVGEPMAAHSEPILYEAGRLTVAADGPAWASRVRQQEAALVRTLRADPELKALREIKVNVRPTRSAAAPSIAPPRRPSRISPRAARLVRDVAASIGDPELRAALERLGDVKEKK
jgi:hypothetical protein